MLKIHFLRPVWAENFGPGISQPGDFENQVRSAYFAFKTFVFVGFSLKQNSYFFVNLREVGVPSRNILHGRGVGSKSRIRVTGPGGSLGAFDSQNTYRNFSLESFFLGARMRDVYRNFVFRGSTN